MASVDVIADLGDSLVSLLVVGLAGVVDAANIKLSTPDDFEAAPTQPTVTLFLYQIALNTEMRNSPRRSLLKPLTPGGDVRTSRPLLPLDLHFLVTPWANDTKDEYRMMGRILQTFYDHAELGPADLKGESWQEGDSVQVILEQLTLEQQFNIWDPSDIPYRLSLSYLTRVVGIEPGETRSEPPVLTAHFRGSR